MNMAPLFKLTAASAALLALAACAAAFSLASASSAARAFASLAAALASFWVPRTFASCSARCRTWAGWAFWQA